MRVVLLTMFFAVTNFAFNGGVGSISVGDLLGIETVVAQNLPGNKTPTIAELETETESLIAMIWKIAKYVIAIILIIGLGTVIWMVSQNNPKAKEAVIGWIVAVGLYAIGLALVG